MVDKHRIGRETSSKIIIRENFHRSRFFLFENHQRCSSTWGETASISLSLAFLYILFLPSKSKALRKEQVAIHHHFHEDNYSAWTRLPIDLTAEQ